MVTLRQVTRILVKTAVLAMAGVSATTAVSQVVYCGGERYWGACPSAPQAQPQAPQGPTPQQLEERRQRSLSDANESGIAAYNKGDYATALHYFERAYEYGPHNPTIKHSIERSKERLSQAEAARAAASSAQTSAYNQLIAANAASVAASRASAANYSGDVGGTGASLQARVGFDAGVHAAAGIPLRFYKTLSPSSDPIVPTAKLTAPIRALEEKRDEARVEARKIHVQREALEAKPMTPVREKKDATLKSAEIIDEKKIVHLNLGIEKALN